MALRHNEAIPLNPLRAREAGSQVAGDPARPVETMAVAPEASEGGVITSRQIRAGRALLGWSQGKLAKAADVGPATIARIELGTIDPKASSLKAIADALKAAGVRLFDDSDGIGEGARMAKPDAP